MNGDLLTDADLARAPAKEPAKLWRNLYRSRWGRWLDPAAPNPRWGSRVWPSHEIAEQRALAAIETLPGWREGVDYLGAFPETD